MPSNRAAWLTAKQARPLEVSDAPMPELKPGHVIIETKAIGINPVDAMIQQTGMIAEHYPSVPYQVIMGLDGAGMVYAVADDVTHVKAGDRVLAFTDGDAISGRQRGTFQAYFLAQARYVALLPAQVSFTDGAVLPSCLVVAATSLFDPKCLGLDLPPVRGRASANGKVVVIWAGGSVVGSCAVQLAKLAGYEVFTTSSVHNFEYCRNLGADEVFDYKESNVVPSILAAVNKTGKQCVGAFGAYLGTDKLCAELIRQLPSSSGHSNIVATVMPEGYGFSVPEGWPENVECRFLLTESERMTWLWREWLSIALEDKTWKCQPDAEVVGKGLEFLQEGMDRWSKGVSAKKIVVEV
ncbi:GroES-like protein [Polychaeton citri CBS 116435]|uniref:GroES-like protein n=1 Tax=Polychaeton citri CBS 116435 TaxID=1314669 RepID=A0A9P4Q5N0_9PEZI|nr:GroES-like protein [Polychaeton citri CBS 116435]